MDFVFQHILPLPENFCKNNSPDLFSSLPLTYLFTIQREWLHYYHFFPTTYYFSNVNIVDTSYISLYEIVCLNHELSFTNFNFYGNFLILIQYLDLVTCYFALTSFQTLLFHVFYVKNQISHILIIIILAH